MNWRDIGLSLLAVAGAGLIAAKVWDYAWTHWLNRDGD
jgi:hypothetical protein